MVTHSVSVPASTVVGEPLLYDSILIVGFGGPERRDDVLPFLENVTRGRNVPRERLLEVAHHYDRFDGVSPINAQTRALIAALRAELDQHGIALPIYWGNRNWHPMLADALAEMASHQVKAGSRGRPCGVQLIFKLPPVSRRYRAGTGRSRSRRTGRRQGSRLLQSPRLHRRQRRAHPRRPRANARRIRPYRTSRVHGSQHSHLDGPKLRLRAPACRDLPIDRRGGGHPPRTLGTRVPEPERAARAIRGSSRISSIISKTYDGAELQSIVIQPVGFLSDHMEVLYDLDHEAQPVCEELGLLMVRAGTVGTHPRFISMLRELIAERLSDVSGTSRRALARTGPAMMSVPRNAACPDKIGRRSFLAESNAGVFASEDPLTISHQWRSDWP